MKKIVIDTNIYISVIFWEGFPRKVIDFARKDLYQICISYKRIKEIKETFQKKIQKIQWQALRVAEERKSDYLKRRKRK